MSTFCWEATIFEMAFIHMRKSLCQHFGRCIWPDSGSLGPVSSTFIMKGLKNIGRHGLKRWIGAMNESKVWGRDPSHCLCKYPVYCLEFKCKILAPIYKLLHTANNWRSNYRSAKKCNDYEDCSSPTIWRRQGHIVCHIQQNLFWISAKF